LLQDVLTPSSIPSSSAPPLHFLDEHWAENNRVLAHLQASKVSFRYQRSARPDKGLSDHFRKTHNDDIAQRWNEEMAELNFENIKMSVEEVDEADPEALLFVNAEEEYS
jgi:hypothetical protein